MNAVVNMRDDEENTSESIEAFEDMGEEDVPSLWSILKRLLELSIPMTLSYTFTFQMVFLVYLLSHIDEDEDNLAAITLITSLINTIIVVGICPLFSMSMIVGREIGELQTAENNAEDETLLKDRRDHIAGANRNGLLISAAITPLMVSGMVFAKPILIHVFNQNEVVASITQNFVRPYALTTPAAMVRQCSEQIMFSFGRTKPAMIIALTSCGICMSFGSALALGSFGFPQMGKTGVLIGCISDAYLTALAFTLYIVMDPRFKSFKFFDLLKPLGPNVGQLKKIIHMGSSFLFAISTETMLALATSAIAGLVGTDEQVAFSGIMLFALVSIILQSAFGQSCSQEMSRKLGEKRFAEVSRLGRVGLITTVGFIAPIPLVLAFDPDILLMILGENNESVREMLHYLVPIIAAGCLSDALRSGLLQQLRVLGDEKGSALISSSALALGMGASAVLGLKTNMGISGVATGYTGGITLGTIALLYRWLSRIKPEAIKKHQEAPVAAESVRQCLAAFFRPALTPLQRLMVNNKDRQEKASLLPKTPQ